MLDRASTFYVRHVPDPEIAAARRARKPHEPDPGDITARPTAEVRDAGRAGQGNEDRCVQHGKMSRRLSRLPPEGRAVFAIYFGDAGSKWAQGPGLAGRIGRLGSILHLTEAGQRLARRDEKKTRGAAVPVSAEARLETAVVLQDLQPQPARESLLSLALRQAQELFDRACVQWNDTANVPDKR